MLCNYHDCDGGDGDGDGDGGEPQPFAMTSECFGYSVQVHAV